MLLRDSDYRLKNLDSIEFEDQKNSEILSLIKRAQSEGKSPVDLMQIGTMMIQDKRRDLLSHMMDIFNKVDRAQLEQEGKL